MTDALELVRATNRETITLPVSGLSVEVRHPRMRDCVLAGEVPLPVLEQLVERQSDPEQRKELTNEDLAHLARFNDEIVKRSLVAVEGLPIDDAAAVVAELRDDDLQYVVSWVMGRNGGKEGPS